MKQLGAEELRSSLPGGRTLFTYGKDWNHPIHEGKHRSLACDLLNTPADRSPTLKESLSHLITSPYNQSAMNAAAIVEMSDRSCTWAR